MSFAPTCAAPASTVPFHRVKFANAGLQGYALAYNKSKAPPTVDLPCGPLSPVLADIFAARDPHWDHKNTTSTTTTPVLRPTLDFFSLEVEGVEALVLSTIDFHAVRIHVLMIEIHSHFCKDDACKSRQPVRAKRAVEEYHRYEDVIPASDMYVHPDSPYQISDAVATPNR